MLNKIKQVFCNHDLSLFEIYDGKYFIDTCLKCKRKKVAFDSLSNSKWLWFGSIRQGASDYK